MRAAVAGISETKGNTSNLKIDFLNNVILKRLKYYYY